MREIESHSTDDIIDELYVRGYSLAHDGYDYVDSCLFEDIISVFDSLDCFSPQKQQTVINLLKSGT